MIRAAARSILRVLRMRPSGRSGSSSGSPRTSGIMLTPVSKPGLDGDLVEAGCYDHEVNQQIGPDHGDRDADRLPESLEEDPTEHREQCQGDKHSLIPQGLRPEW